MRLYFFRSTPEIPVENIEKVAEKVSQVFNIDYSLFTGQVTGSVEQIRIEDLLRLSDQLLERGDPVVAIAYTQEGVDDQDIFGQASQLNRGAWVRWSEKLKQVTITTIHELGHICEAEHCINESCVMFHTYKEHEGNSLNTLFCDRCRAAIQNSWVYNRLTHATEDRAKKKQTLPKTVRSPPLQITHSTPNRQPTPVNRPFYDPIPATPPFPDWSLANSDKEEFIRQAMEHFGLRRR